jgi:flagellar hook protein FlgE
MSNTYYTSLSGMLAASYGLQNTSNNVANMHSPGFKRNDVFYSSLGSGNGDQGLGAGVCIGGNATNFSEGTYMETNSPSDLAIIGQGFFVIRLKNGELRYTRDGEFGFNDKGILIDKHSGGQVQGYNSSGNLVAIHEKGPKISMGKATTELFLKGQLMLIEKSNDTGPVPTPDNDPGPLKNNYENIKFSAAKIYDAQGKAHELHFEFRSVLEQVKEGKQYDDGTSWELIGVTCEDKEVAIHFSPDQHIRFNGTSQGAKDKDCSIQFTVNGTQEVKLRFGTYRDGADGSVQLKDSKYNPGEKTKIEVKANDGYGEGKQISFSFDENGRISYNYDNGQIIEGIHVGLARFDDLEHSLIQTKDNLFAAKTDKGTHIGRANKDGFGSIRAKQVESSNVDSTTEFANIVVLQRMFQACSQIMDIDKKLLEELESR